jgi:hypothetical protein
MLQISILLSAYCLRSAVPRLLKVEAAARTKKPASGKTKA